MEVREGYNKGEIFLKVDSVEAAYHEGYSPFDFTRLSGIKVWIGNTGYFFPCDTFTVCDPDVVREDGRRQAFDLFKELYDMSPCDRQEAFDKIMMLDLVSKNTYEEIVKKLDAWKKEKKEIHVRDEVYNKTLETKFVITKIYTPCDGDVIVNGLKKDGTAVKGLLLCNVEKTGLHVDDLDAYLEV